MTNNAKKLIRDGLFVPTHRNKKNGQYAALLAAAKDITTDQRGKEKMVFTTASGNTWIMSADEFAETYRPYAL